MDSQAIIQITPDHKVIRQLMEESPEFAVQLRKGVLESAVKHTTFKFITADDRSPIAKMVAAATNEFISNAGFNSRGTPYVREKLREVIEREVARQVEDLVTKTVRKVVNEQFDALRAEITERATEARAERRERFLDYFAEYVSEEQVVGEVTHQLKLRINEVLKE